MLAVCLAVAAGLGFAAWRQGSQGPAPGPAAVGGAFQMVDQDGKDVNEGLLRGKWNAMFFGYTYCPDICPATLTALGGATQRLGPKADKLRVVFVTVDPARDTPAQIRTYLASPVFPRGAVGLTGTPEQVTAMTRAYKAYAAKNGAGADYLMDHTSAIYLIDPKGRFVTLIRPDAGPEGIANQISEAMG